MRKIFLLVMSLIAVVLIQAQTITLTPLSPEIYCSSGVDSFRATWSNVPSNTNIVFYQSTDSSFNPYLGQGDSIGYIAVGTTPSSSGPITSACPRLLGIFIDACNDNGRSEPANEYIIMTSGNTGFLPSNLQVDIPNNRDINMGSNPCAFQTPSAALMTLLRTGSCTSLNLLPAGPSDFVPANALVVIFTGNGTDYPYNFSGLCGLGQPVYILQNACTQSTGSFANNPPSSCPNAFRTTAIYTGSCSDKLTYAPCSLPPYDMANPNANDGNYVIRLNDTDTSSTTNGGIRNNAADKCNGVILDSSVQTQVVRYTIPNDGSNNAATNFCNTGYHYIKAITHPVGTQPISNAVKFKLVCVDFNAIPQTTSICNGDRAIINISGSDPNATYSWTVSSSAAVQGATAGSGNTINQALTNTGSALDSVTYIITAKDSICSLTKLVKVYVSSGSGLAFTFGANSTTVCKRDSISLDAGLGYSSYLWSTGETSSKITVKQAGVYWVIVTKNGCRGGDTISVTEIDKFIPFSLGRDTAFCGTFSVLLNSNIPQTSWLKDNVPFATASSVTVNQPGTYIARASNSCGSVSDTIVITSVSASGVNLGRDTAICQGTSVTLNATATGSNNQYLWKTGETSSSIVVNLPGVYWVSVFNGTCSSSDTVVISLINKPDPISLGNDTSFCGTFSKVLLGGNANTVWSTGEVGPQIIINAPGTYTAENRNQCALERDAITISRLPSPLVNIGRDTSICDSIFLNVGSGTYTSILWSTGEVSESILVSSAGVYSVLVSDNICSASDTIRISKECFYEVYLPSGFSPNGDNLNDVLVPLSTEQGMQVIDFFIFDRWGEKLFESHDFIPGDISKGWDGRFKGKDSPTDVYVFTYSAKMPDDKIKSYKGTVSLVR